MKAIVALIVILAVASANKKIVNTKQSLVQINEDALGNSILSVIQLHLSTGAPIDQINLLLNNIATGIKADQKRADSVQDNDVASCEKLINDMESEINYHEVQLVATAKLQEDTTNALAEAEKEVRVATKDIEKNESTFASEKALREQQHATWEQKDAEHEQQIEAIDEASKIVQHLQAGVAFAQVKSRFEKVQAKLAEGKHALFKPLIQALTQLASKVDNKSIIKILDLLGQVRQQLVASRNLLKETEEKQAAQWVVQSAHLTEEHKRLSERKQFLEAAISNYKQVLEQCIESLEDHQLGLEDEQEALRIQKAWCEIQFEAYEEQTVERERSLDVIERLQEHIAENLSQMGSFLQEREEVF